MDLRWYTFDPLIHSYFCNAVLAVERLIKMLRLKGCVVVADALNCQKATASAIISHGADYVLSMKDNQANLKRDIEDYIQDK